MLRIIKLSIKTKFSFHRVTFLVLIIIITSMLSKDFYFSHFKDFKAQNSLKSIAWWPVQLKSYTKQLVKKDSKKKRKDF